MIIYLAGGMHTDWQDRIMSAAPEHEYYDPRSHGLSDPVDYTNWDLTHIANSSLVVAYLEEDNPGGANTALEVGYAYALGKPIFLVDEKQDRYFSMMRVLSMNFPTFERLISALVDLQELSRSEE
jgi:nucleoside 2-deoxyribosyltransferase